MAIDVIDGGDEAVLEFLPGCDADVAEHRACELGEEAFDEIEPEPCFGVKTNSNRPARCSASQPARLFRDACGMICRGSVLIAVRAGIKQLKEFNKFAAAAAVLDQGMDLAQ
jgi:hypothetical protein